MEKLVECSYALEDYAALEGVLDVLQPDDPLLARMGTMFRCRYIFVCNWLMNRSMKTFIFILIHSLVL